MVWDFLLSAKIRSVWGLTKDSCRPARNREVEIRHTKKRLVHLSVLLFARTEYDSMRGLYRVATVS